MVRLCVSVAVLVVLTSAYLVHPFAGWAALGLGFVLVAATRRWKKGELHAAEAGAS